MLAGAPQVSAGGHAQTVTYRAVNEPLTNILSVVKKQTGFTFIYNDEEINNAKKVSVDLVDEELNNAMRKILLNQPFTYVVEGKTIVISKQPVKDFNSLLNIDIPPITVRGRIINEKGEPVVASIFIKGTSIGASSDNEGYFEISNVEENAVLIISGVGIETQEKKYWESQHSL